MKKLLSVALLFLPLACKADLSDWTYPVLVPSVAGLATYLTYDKDSFVSNLLVKATEGSGCELIERVLFNSLNQNSNLGMKIDNGLKQVLIDSGFNTGALIANDFLLKDDSKSDENQNIAYKIIKNPFFRTILLFSLKNTLGSAIGSLSSLASSDSSCTAKPVSE